MKKIGLFFILLISLISTISTTANGQKAKKNEISVHFVFGDNQYFNIGKLDGAASYSGKYYFGIGVENSWKLSERWDFSTGVQYTFNRIDLNPTQLPDFTTDDIIIVNTGIQKDNINLFSVPFRFKFRFGKYFFANAGASIHVSGVTHSILAFGPDLGIGAQYAFASGITIFINPYAEWIIGDKNILQHQGARLGLSYKF
jgi:outer membrane receptor protein involved in Fe transport